MGWISGGAVVEAQVIALYNKQMLTAEILDVIMEPFKETDCDTAGFQSLNATDGKDVYEIICYVMKPMEYENIVRNLQGKNFIDSDAGYELWKSIWQEMWDIW